MSGYVEEVWKQIFLEESVVQEVTRKGFIDIEAKLIREKYKREPRLMTKFDQSVNLPKIFHKYGFSLLAVNHGTYRIGDFNPYLSVEEFQSSAPLLHEIDLSNIETLDIQNVYSEPAVMNIAHATGLLEREFGTQLEQTVLGRMRTGDFSFAIDSAKHGTSTFDVSGVQIEIDAGYECEDFFVVFEVKNFSTQDCNLRQLYYPYRHWAKKIQKPVRSVYLTRSNDVYSFFEVVYDDPMNLSTSRFSKTSHYKLHQEFEPNQALPLIPLKLDFSAPFPQADVFTRIIDLVMILLDSDKSLSDLASQYSFDQRQSGYYTSAARYLGLISTYRTESGSTMFTPTTGAIELFGLPGEIRNRMLAQQVLKVPGCKQILELWLSEKSRPSISDCESILSRLAIKGISGNTVRRRASSISGWVGWIIESGLQDCNSQG